MTTEPEVIRTMILNRWIQLWMGHLALALACRGAEVLGGPLTNPANSHRYYLLSEDTWQASERKAQDLGGHLATVNDLAEQNWIFAQFGAWGGVQRSLWIGLREVGGEGVFRWSSGESLGFTRWLPSQPDNSPVSGGESFVHMINASNIYGHPGGFWNDIASPNKSFPTFDPICGVVEVVPELPPVLSIRSSDPAALEICYSVTPGRTYDLLYCADLRAPVWDAVAVVSGAQAEGCLSIQGLPGPQGFYRLRSR